MNKFPPAISAFVKELSKFPGIGSKTATRMAFFALSRDKNTNLEFLSSFKTLTDNIKICSLCGNISESDPCHICKDSSRNRHLLCIVENAFEIYTIEQANVYNGIYYVLGGVIDPLNGITPQKLNLPRLHRRIKEGGISEVILAINPNVEGETTALYIKNMLKDTPIRLSRLAFGIPVGGSIEFTDNLTISRALNYRQKF